MDGHAFGAGAGQQLHQLAARHFLFQQHVRQLAEAQSCIGLGYKLLVCPALVVVLLWAADASPDMVSRVGVISAAMPSMIGAAVVALQANLAPKLVSMMVGLGIPLGLAIAPAWLGLFDHLAG